MGKKEIEYYTVISDKPTTLDDNVNTKLSQGWQLQGGVSVCAVKTDFPTDKKLPDIWWVYAQAIVREKK